MGRPPASREARRSIQRTATSARDDAFELLYCEACGDLVVGGRPRRRHERHERHGDLSFAGSAGFGEASRKRHHRTVRGCELRRVSRCSGRVGVSRLAATITITPGSKVISIQQRASCGTRLREGSVHGRLLRRDAAEDRHGRKADGIASAVPYCCPRCGTELLPSASERRTPYAAKVGFRPFEASGPVLGRPRSFWRPNWWPS